MLQSWHDLLFAHWPLAPAAIQPLLPSGLVVETFDGAAWLGIVPFRVELRVRWLPPLPGASAFPELNLRTYVRAGDRPGVWFFSLDAGSALAVAAARAFYALPYHRARMACERDGEAVAYSSERTHRGSPPASFAGRYGPQGAAFTAEPGSLEHWLTERYCLYAARGSRLLRAEIDHASWPLQPAWAQLEARSMALAAELELPERAPLLHFARRQEVHVWAPHGV
ncbi:MAG TPA: DUF2071 domain-containing protein [Planctomycetota bacterium]|nr:DUF2071 domain-containing protein [Planctomycetota bacterium]